jgi:hypothetical protein
MANSHSIVIQTIDLTDSPNSGRIKLNSNFLIVQQDFDEKIERNGSIPFTGDCDLGNNQVINLAPGIDDTDALNLGQAKTISNKLISRNTAYVIPALRNTSEWLYLDGTTGDEIALRVSTPELAVDIIHPNSGIIINGDSNSHEATSGNQWIIKIEKHPTYYASQSLAQLTDYMRVAGIDKPIIELKDDASVAGQTTLNQNTEFENVIFNYHTGQQFNISNGIYEDCIIYMSAVTSGTPKQLKLSNVKMTKCKLIGMEEIILDATSSNFINNCEMSVDFTGTGTNCLGAVNVIEPNLETLYTKQISI